MHLSDYDHKILAILTCDSGFTTGDIAERVRPMFGSSKRQHSGAVLSWLRRLEKAGLAKRMDQDSPICWVKAKESEGSPAPTKAEEPVPGPRRYTIRSVADMAKIPTDRLDAFLADLRTALFLSRAQGNLANAFCQGIDPGLQAGCSLHELDWVDDGLGTVRPQLDGKPLGTIPEEKVQAVINGMNGAATGLRDRI
jgi:hypothetical protein